VADPASVAKIRGLLSDARGDTLRRLRPLLEESGGLDSAWQLAKQHVRLALESLEVVADSEASRALRTLAHFVIRRPT
jgi:octaprenyl-diphosphate synthase